MDTHTELICCARPGDNVPIIDVGAGAETGALIPFAFEGIAGADRACGIRSGFLVLSLLKSSKSSSKLGPVFR